ncbi:methyltransferase [Thermomonas sp.]|uniref:class I SAM-dependent methyltransferase n=1 Tax=Thermomonas sp. TaxID=1971895 RepID=UPI00248A245F|nr:methyltransferase [Thermomonas sp.]MDI1252655.1 methyltransferase [Thermomonas sp.]
MSYTSRDIALDALFYPFSAGLLQWPADGVLFLRGREGAALHAQRGDGMVGTQPFKPEAVRLTRIGIDLIDEDALPPGKFPLVLVLPPRQREEARALLAKACAAVAEGGVVVVSVSNDEGAKSREADLKQLAGSVSLVSKHHCRVFWTAPDAAIDTALQAQWACGDVPRRIASPDVPGDGFQTRPGVFAWDRVDAASAMLASALPNDVRGRVADFGAGWGYLALQVMARCPQVTSLDLYEADARALALADANLADAPGSERKVPVHFHWQDVAAGVAERFDAIVCNPPFHALGRGDRPDIGRAFIDAAAQALNPGGRLWLVANRHLPYEQALADGFADVAIVAQQGGFKIVQATKAAAARAVQVRAPKSTRNRR